MYQAHKNVNILTIPELPYRKEEGYYVSTPHLFDKTYGVTMIQCFSPDALTEISYAVKQFCHSHTVIVRTKDDKKNLRTFNEQDCG